MTDDAFETVLVTREETVVGVLSGVWLDNKRGALLCQSSGLANTFNALSSLSVPAGIPFVGIATRRGDLGEFNHAQVTSGYHMDALLDDVAVRNQAVHDEDRVGQRCEWPARRHSRRRCPTWCCSSRAVTGYKKETK